MRRLFVIVNAGFLLLSAGCGQSRSEAPPAAPPPARNEAKNEAEGQALPKLPVVKLWVGTQEIEAEIAHTLDHYQRGLMHRTKLGENEGMLFVFGPPRQVAFYMKNTSIPLTCAYIDPEGKILELHDMTPFDETPIPSRATNVQYVLEMNKGWFKKHNITEGMVIGTERGTLKETFFDRAARN